MNPVTSYTYKPWEFAIIQTLFPTLSVFIETRQRTVDVNLPAISTEIYLEARKFIEDLLTRANYEFSVYTISQSEGDLFLGVKLTVSRDQNPENIQSELINAYCVDKMITEAEQRPLNHVLSIVFSKMFLIMNIVILEKHNSFELTGIPSVHIEQVKDSITKWLVEKKFSNITFNHTEHTQNSEVIVLSVFFEHPKE
jgi:hypothetical protein